MSGDRRNTNKQYTGTVPKIRYRNNTNPDTPNDQQPPRNVSNNLTNAWQISQRDFTNIARNSRRNQQNFLAMDATVDESLQDGITHLSLHANGIPTSNASTSVSRRNSGSSTLKCDNVTKYPDKKQIEDKLDQIREYLQITTSLMTSMKNTEDQKTDFKNLQKTANDLQDSEQKLIHILEQINENEPIDISEVNDKNDNQASENGTENTSDHGSFQRNEELESDALKEQQLLQLKQNTENKLKDIWQIHENLACVQHDNSLFNPNQKDTKNIVSMADIDAAISELEERARKVNRPTHSSSQDKILTEVETLHKHIVSMHNANNEREQLIEVLDNRDAQLKSQQVELQGKLAELQTKKSQIDNLVVQLHSLASEDGEEIGHQVRKIVTMKEQLKKLKDMLEVVKTTENVMTSNANSIDAQTDACSLCTSSENFLQNEFQKSRSNPNDNNSPKDALSQKQVNKNSSEQSKKSKSRTSSITEKLALQAELEAKKKELEEIMGKHKAGTSNLNHDVGIDTKSEFSCTSNTINERSFWPLPNQDNSSDRFSSDDIEDDDFPELHNNRNLQPSSILNYSVPKSSKGQSDNPDYEFPIRRLQAASCTPERNIRDNSDDISVCIQEQPRANNTELKKMQEQLQVIKSMCDSMIEQQNSSNQRQNVQQLRNNLTPSPLHSEQRYVPSNTHAVNALNIANTNIDGPWFPNSHGNQNNSIVHDMNYQSWLATNTLQTQSFMLNTLNQCCQMLWLQQRELACLRNAVSVLQEQMDSPNCRPHNHHNSIHPSHQSPPRPPPAPKVNQVSAACSMPNLNHYNASPSNLDTYPNMSGRLLDPCLNNMNDVTNNMLHGVNTNLNQPLPSQMWHGQALNNQVPPGNRANNYWDNFRSYSRQNLLSTKNSDGFHNFTSLDRSNTGSDRTNPFTLMSFSKSNSEQDSSTSQETTPQRRAPFKWHPSSNAAVPDPPVDLLNVNRSKDVRDDWLPSNSTHENCDDLSMGLNMLLNLNSNEANLYRSEVCIPKEGLPKPISRRNNGGNENRPQKSKLFEELRDNVYKEVASLISANEARPHFLIQLFRDLQMIGSDTLRLKILQSIQSVITHSISSNQQSVDSQQQPKENENTNHEENISLQTTVWSKPVKNVSSTKNIINLATESVEIDDIFKDVIPFLGEHDDEIIQHNFLINLKQMFLESDCLKGHIKDSIFKKHFSSILDEVLEQYCDKSVRDIKIHLIQTLRDLLRSEISFIQLIQETKPDPSSVATNDAPQQNLLFHEDLSPSLSFNQKVENIQNGDLAEADQTRMADINMEEVGAVGGIIEVKDPNGMNGTEGIEEMHCDIELTYMQIGQEVEVKSLSEENSEEILNLPSIEFQCSSEGLDQVPTRLPIKSKSRLPLKNKSRSASPNNEEQ